MRNTTVVLSAAAIAILSAWQLRAQDATPQMPAAACLSRLQQSALALSMYARDNDARFPPANEWNDALAPLIPKPVAAVSKTDAQTDSPFDCPLLGAGEWGYSMNWKLSKRAMSEVESPASTVSIYETNVPRANANYDGRDMIFRHARAGADGKSESGGNFAFADGSARWIPATTTPNFRIFLDNKPPQKPR